MFSKACEHGVKAIIFIATQSMEGKRSKLSDIAESAGSPEAFTAKILSLLSKNKIIESTTGPTGGFFIDIAKQKEISLKHVVVAIDGDSLFKTCVLGLKQCDSKNPCPIHQKFLPIRTQLTDAVSQTNIFELASGLKTGESVLTTL